MIDHATKEKIIRNSVLADEAYMPIFDKRINEIENGTVNFVSWESIKAKIKSMISGFKIKC